MGHRSTKINNSERWLITVLVISIGFAPYINVAEVTAAAPPRRPILASPAPGATNATAGAMFQMSATASSSYVQFKQLLINQLRRSGLVE